MELIGFIALIVLLTAAAAGGLWYVRARVQLALVSPKEMLTIRLGNWSASGKCVRLGSRIKNMNLSKRPLMWLSSIRKREKSLMSNT